MFRPYRCLMLVPAGRPHKMGDSEGSGNVIGREPALCCVPSASFRESHCAMQPLCMSTSCSFVFYQFAEDLPIAHGGCCLPAKNSTGTTVTTHSVSVVIPPSSFLDIIGATSTRLNVTTYNTHCLSLRCGSRLPTPRRWPSCPEASRAIV